MSRQLSTTRPFTRGGATTHPHAPIVAGGAQRPVAGGVPAMAPWFKPAAVYQGHTLVFAGMDPSDPATYVRPWRPRPGMIARLNFDGAQIQGDTDMGGLWGAPAWASMPVGGRPARRPR